MPPGCSSGYKQLLRMEKTREATYATSKPMVGRNAPLPATETNWFIFAAWPFGYLSPVDAHSAPPIDSNA